MRTLILGLALTCAIGLSPPVIASTTSDLDFMANTTSDGVNSTIATMTQNANLGAFVNDVNFINSSTTMLGSMQDTQIFVASNTFNAGASANFMDVNSNNQDLVRNQVLGVTTASAWSSSTTLNSDQYMVPLDDVELVANMIADNRSAENPKVEAACRDVINNATQCHSDNLDKAGGSDELPTTATTLTAADAHEPEVVRTTRNYLAIS